MELCVVAKKTNSNTAAALMGNSVARSVLNGRSAFSITLVRCSVAWLPCGFEMLQKCKNGSIIGSMQTQYRYLDAVPPRYQKDGQSYGNDGNHFNSYTNVVPILLNKCRF